MLDLVQCDHVENFLAALLDVTQFDQENLLDVDTCVDKEMNQFEEHGKRPRNLVFIAIFLCLRSLRVRLNHI